MSLSKMMLRMHEEGHISDQILLLYGMSGDLPAPENYRNLEEYEKRKFWNTRMEQNLGPNWRERFSSLPSLLKKMVASSMIPQWVRDGF